MTDQTPWCCTGTGYVSECPLCPEYGTRMIDPCPGHPADDANQQVVDTARLHAERRHPGFEYATTRGPRKQWDDPDRPPVGENADPDHTWKPNVDAGRPGMGWDRFDYHEEAYWRRPKSGPREAPSGPESVQEPSGGELAGRDRDSGAEAASGGSGWTQLEARAFNAVGPAVRDAGQWLSLSARRAVANAVLAELEPELDALAEYEHTINWMTTCTSCARILDSCIRETERAERAEAAIARVRAECGRLHRASVLADGQTCCGIPPGAACAHDVKIQ
jgi:hypothetical protein